MKRDRLFTGESIHEYLRTIERDIESKIADPNYNELSYADLKDKLIMEYGLNVPELNENEIFQVSPEEVDIPLENTKSTELTRAKSKRGLRYTIFVPFDGDGKFFQYSPSRYKEYSSYGIVKLNRLMFCYDACQDESSECVAREFEQDLQKIRQPLFHLTMAVETFLHKMISKLKFPHRVEQLQKVG